MLLVEDGHIVGELAACIGQLKELLAFLLKLESGNFPEQRELDKAPLLSPYGVSLRPSVCLIGGNQGHPLLQGNLIRTSEAWVIATSLGWARTYGRLYRLGEQVDPVVTGPRQ